MPIKLDEGSSRVIIASISLPFVIHREVQSANADDDFTGHDSEPPLDLKSLHNHPALLAGSSFKNKLFIGAVPTTLSEQEQALFNQQNCLALCVDSETFQLHLNGYCKDRIWSLLHYHLWDKPLLDVHLEKSLFTSYDVINKAFAKAIAAVIRPNDLILVVDYHLLMVPSELRHLAINNPVGLFIKAPVSSYEYVRCLPQAKQVLRGAMGANVVVVQAEAYSRHCASCCLRILDLDRESIERSELGSVIRGEVDTLLRVLPLGINIDKARELRTTYGVMEKFNQVKKLFSGEESMLLILGIDRADQMRGIKHKFDAYKLFLQTYPEWIGKVVLFQICIPDHVEDRDAELKVNELVNTINSKYGSLTYTPLHYHQRDIAEEEYFALLSSANIYLNTVERDSIVLVPLEYAICQEDNNSDSCGVLIMSEFTGFSDCVQEGAVLKMVSEAIHTAATMKRESRVAMMNSLIKHVELLDAKIWSRNVYSLLEASRSFLEKTELPLLEIDLLKPAYQHASNRYILLDYDGTLTPIVQVPEEAFPSQRCQQILARLCADPRNHVYVISGRDQKSLVDFVGHVHRLGLSAEHGCFLKDPDASDWVTTFDQADNMWRQKAKAIFEHFTEQTFGSHIEEKRSSLTWHYRRSDPDYGPFQAAACLAQLHTVLTNAEVNILCGKRNIEVRPASTNKGQIVRRIIASSEHPVDFCLCAGDDTTDEDMFRALAACEMPCFTCWIGDQYGSHTNGAKYRALCTDHLLRILESLIAL